MSEWQPIETAPKDDECILATSSELGHMGIVVFDGREWECVDFQGRRMGIGFYPTHWMFLPDTPDD
jgi:hypothetical protein